MTRSARPGTSRPRASLRRALALLVTSVAVVATGVAAAGPAAAHARLRSTTPAAASSVASAPQEVVLRFNEPPIGVGTAVRVTGPDGEVVSTGPARVVDDEVRQTLGAGLGGGTYRVDWRVTSDDGHPVSDTFTFTVAAGTGAAGSPTTAADPTPLPTVADPALAEPARHDGGGPPWLALVAAALVAVLGYPLTRSLLRHRKARNP